MQVSYGDVPEGTRFADWVSDYDRIREKAGRIFIDIFDVSVKPEEVAAEYRNTLNAFGLKESASGEGGFSWQAIPGVVRMVFDPRPPDPSLDMLSHYLKNSPGGGPEHLSFPAAEFAAEMYAAARGFKRGRVDFQGVGLELPGSRTRQPAAKTVVPACAAWFLAGEKSHPDFETKTRVTEILNTQLLRRHDLGEVNHDHSRFNQLWGNVRKRGEDFERLKSRMPESLRHSKFIDGYFSARDMS